MDKIYSRRRFIIPKLNINKNDNKRNHRLSGKKVYIVIIMMIAIVTSYKIIEAINPIIEAQCKNIAKSIATQISNEQASTVMSKYSYDNLCTITKDDERKYLRY
jgi:hypothetical protein